MKDNIDDINKKYCNNNILLWIICTFLFLIFFLIVIKNRYLISTKIYRLVFFAIFRIIVKKALTNKYNLKNFR